MLPTISYDHDKGYTFTLWRDEKHVVHEFKNFSVTLDENHETIVNGFSSLAIHGIHERIMPPQDLAKIGGPACDGVFYYICAVPYRGEDRIIWLSKEEYDILLPILHDIQDDIQDESDESDGNEECDYCHGPVGRCGYRCRDSDLY